MKVNIPIIVTTIPPKGYHIFVEGKIDHKRVLFLIDTGASKSVVDLTYATKYFPHTKLIQTDHLTTGLGANIPNSTFIKLNRLKIGKTGIRAMKFAILDLKIVNDAYASAKLKPVVAIIGGDILKKYKAVIDYEQKLLSLSL